MYCLPCGQFAWCEPLYMMGADDVDEEIEVVVDGVVEMSMLSG
jgi:hypothetical protein